MSLKKQIWKLQREFNKGGGVITTVDGEEISYGENELFDALLAAIEGGEHRLLPYILKTDTEFAELVRALEGPSPEA